MNQGFYIALSGAKLQELRLDTVANNLANAKTSGFKADKVSSGSFEMQLQNAIGAPSYSHQPLKRIEDMDSPMHGFGGSYSKTLGVRTSFKQGDHKFTGNPLNIALDGPGFISLKTPNGTRYTRQGNYLLNSAGEMITPDGFAVKGKGLSELGTGKITIDTEGTVFLDGTQKGQIDLVEFDNTNILRKEGHNLFALRTEGNFEKKSKNTTVKQGFLEMSNINVMKEMVNLIDLNRMYESYQKVMTSIDESMRQVINEVGGN